MMRLVAILVLCLGLIPVVLAEDVPEPEEIVISLDQFVVPSTRSFTDVAMLPTRLTSYNAHDDAARATYSCCRPDQEEKIAKALAANAAFLDAYRFSDWADDTLMHNARVNSVRKNFREEITAYAQLLKYYPGSDLADDAAWGLARMHVKDGADNSAVKILNGLVKQYPLSTWADDAYLSLSQALERLEDERGALAALEALSQRYPHSDHCADAALKLGKKYQERGNYPAAIDAFNFVARRYPSSDLADDAQFGIATCLRSMQRDEQALAAYEFIIHRMAGSAFVPEAMREVNTILKRHITTTRGQASRTPGDKYDLSQKTSKDAADKLYKLGCHNMNYRQYKSAIQAFRQLVTNFPGCDCYDDALYKIGVAYQEMNILFQEINQAKGPDDLFRLTTQWKDATGARAGIPSGQQLNAINDCVSAFSLVAGKLIGSTWRDDAVYQIAKSFEDVEKPDQMAHTYQQLLINFPGSPYEMEALYEVLKFYADAKNYETSMKMFPQLSKAAPGIFPSMMAENRTDFLHIMSNYSGHLNFAWDEYHVHHIPYRVTLPDLVPKAALHTGAMCLERGRTTDAIKHLKRVADVPTCNECGAATYLLAVAYERSGQPQKATELYTDIQSRFALSGLADDARFALDRLNGSPPDVTGYASAVGISPEAYDVHVGEHTVVFAPFTVAPRMREYNLPNIWDSAQASLANWMGYESPDKAIIVVTKDGGTRGPIVVPASKMKDPPDWTGGFLQMARRMIDSTECRMFARQMPSVAEGIARFAASSLHYSLVSETRDTIGSAAATVLPHQAVLDQRDNSLRALQEYVRGSPSPDKLTPDVVCGMLYTLLDRHGYGKHALIDWEPYTRFFEAIRQQPRGADAQTMFVHAINEAFDADHCTDFERWGFRVNKAAIERMAMQP